MSVLYVSFISVEAMNWEYFLQYGIYQIEDFLF